MVNRSKTFLPYASRFGIELALFVEMVGLAAPLGFYCDSTLIRRGPVAIFGLDFTPRVPGSLVAPAPIEIGFRLTGAALTVCHKGLARMTADKAWSIMESRYDDQ
jgi:hypothetical protein